MTLHRPGPVTPAQLAALRCAANGQTSRQIARTLATSEHGINLRINAAVTALGATSRTNAVAIALCIGLIRPSDIQIPETARPRAEGAAA